MHRCFKKANGSRASLVLLMLAFALALGAADPNLIEQAKAMLAKADPKGAAALLEAALPKAGPTTRPALLKQLKIAYQTAARDCQAAGNSEEAQEYLDNLEILNRAPSAKKAEPTAPAPATESPSLIGETEPSDPGPGRGITLPLSPREGPKPKGLPTKDLEALRAGAEIKPSATPENLDGPLEFVSPKPDPGAIAPPTGPRESPKPGFLLEGDTPSGSAKESSPGSMPEPLPSLEVAPEEPQGSTVKDADAAFVDKRYDEANSIYRTLNQARALPENRRDHWAYCRAVEVVRKLNTQPSTAKEWADINDEIEQIRKLSPKNWFAEYLKKCVAERYPKSKLKTGAKANAKPSGLLVRGASPEEEAPQAAGSPIAATPRPAPTAVKPNDAAPIETANFRVIHNNRALAERVAKDAEIAREAQVTRWTGRLAAEPWKPRCDIFLYSNAETFSAETGQPKDSPGFSTMGMNSGKIVSRRINLRADHPNVIKAILPHEVTHVVLADLFPTKQIPRWADEGLSVLSEPSSEQAIRAAELEEPLSTGRLFQLRDLMVMDYPDNQYWGLYYAQSVSLTRFLVESGTPLQFVAFVKASQAGGTDAALKQVYKIKSDADLQAKWLAYAKSQSDKAVAASSDTVAEKEASPERR